MLTSCGTEDTACPKLPRNVAHVSDMAKKMEGEVTQTHRRGLRKRCVMFKGLSQSSGRYFNPTFTGLISTLHNKVS